VIKEAEIQNVLNKETSTAEYMALINDVGIVGALAAWRVTQGIYRFDPDVYAEVIDTPITGDLPHDVLFNLPEWCIYIETPGLEFLGKPLTGFFTLLEYDAGKGRKEMRFVLDYTQPGDERPQMMPQSIHLGPWPLLESIDRALEEAEQVTKINPMFEPALEFPEESAKIMQGSFEPLVSLVLYICSVNSDIGTGERRPEKPKPKKTRKGIRLFSPQQATVWDVGIRMGAALRKAREAAGERELREGISDMQRTSPKSHVRRAHWHGYWTGPREGQQKFVLKWLSPILVGSGDDLPVTIRPVK
jgi:hypothetical protein